MKILQVIPIFSPPLLFGGSQRVAYIISKELVKRGHRVSIYTSDMKNTKEKTGILIEDVNGITIVRFKTVSLPLLSKTGLILTPSLKRVAERELNFDTFDVIHVHEARGFQHILVWWLTRKRTVPYVVQAHGNLSEHFGGVLRKIYDEIFGKKVLEDSLKVIAVNKVEANHYKRFGVPEEKIEIIPNPIDAGEFDSFVTKGVFRKKYNIKPNSKVILFMGRVHPIKGLDILLHAFANMIKNGRMDVTLVIAGPDDGYMKECIKIVKAHSLNNVIFTGQLNDKERVQAYVDADVVVLPSRYETFPMVVLEAYACGKPVIASKTGGLKDLIIDGETGKLVEPGNIPELSRALVSVLSSSEKTVKMGYEAKKFVKHFSVEKCVDKLEQLYFSVCK